MKLPIDFPLSIRSDIENLELMAYELASSLHALIKFSEISNVRATGSVALAKDRLRKYAKVEADFAEFHREYAEEN